MPLVVAINKIDRPGADVERTKSMLAELGVVTEDRGGDTVAVAISALKVRISFTEMFHRFAGGS